VKTASILTKSPAIPQQLYKPASRGLSAIAELLVITVVVDLSFFFFFRLWCWYEAVRQPPEILPSKLPPSRKQNLKSGTARTSDPTQVKWGTLREQHLQTVRVYHSARDYYQYNDDNDDDDDDSARDDVVAVWSVNNTCILTTTDDVINICRHYATVG